MKKFTITPNKFLKKTVQGYYNRDYVGYRKEGNPDFLNRLKNSAKSYNELELVQDFIEVAEITKNDLNEIINVNGLKCPLVCILPRSKAQNHYSQSQQMFKKAIESVVKNTNVENGSDYIKRIRDTKTTHNWRLENNTGDMPYEGISKDTCEFNLGSFQQKNVILVDDVYTKDVNVTEDFIQTLFDFGAKSVILYVVAKTRS